MDGQLRLNRYDRKKKYDKVVLFEINRDLLYSTLIRPDDFFRGETAYEGIVPASALTRMLEIPMTERLKRFAGAVQSPRLAEYIDVDLNKHLGIRTFDITD